MSGCRNPKGDAFCAETSDASSFEGTGENSNCDRHHENAKLLVTEVVLTNYMQTKLIHGH
jgi:hypothetical protein